MYLLSDWTRSDARFCPELACDYIAACVVYSRASQRYIEGISCRIGDSERDSGLNSSVLPRRYHSKRDAHTVSSAWDATQREQCARPLNMCEQHTGNSQRITQQFEAHTGRRWHGRINCNGTRTSGAAELLAEHIVNVYKYCAICTPRSPVTLYKRKQCAVNQSPIERQLGNLIMSEWRTVSISREEFCSKETVFPLKKFSVGKLFNGSNVIEMITTRLGWSVRIYWKDMLKRV